MSLYNEEIIELLNKCYTNEEFRSFLDNPADETFYDFRYSGFGKELMNKHNIQLSAGVSKGVFVWYDMGIVIKFPFYYEDKDYCKIELENWQAAVNEKVDECFCPTWFVGDYRGVPIYAAELCNTNESDHIETVEEVYRASGRSAEEFDDYLDNEYYDEEGGTAFMRALLTNEMWERFWNFCQDHHINDLHSGNVGLLGNKPVLIDFSGYESAYD